MSIKTSKIGSKLNKKRLGIFVAVFALLGSAYLVYSLAAAPGTPAFGLYVSPSTSSPAAGQQFTVSVYANMGGRTTIQNMGALLTYDTTLLRLDSANQNGVPNTKFQCTDAVDDGCQTVGTGKIIFGYGKTGATTIPAADGVLLGNLTFTALKPGTASLTFDTNPNLSGFTSVNDPTPASEAADLATRTLLNGTYTLRDGTAPTVPGTPTLTSKTDQAATISWTTSTDEANGSGLAGYKIFRNGTQVGTSTTASFTNSGLTPSTSYSFTVQSYDNAGNNSAQSAQLAVTTNADSTVPTTPGKPTGGTATMTTIPLSWTASTDNVAVTGYKIFRNGTQVGTSATTSYTDTGLNAATSYTYTISAYDAANNNSAVSQSTTLTTAADTQAPTAPTVTLTTPTSTSVGLTWSGSTDNVAVTGYKVYRNGTNIANTLANVTSYTDSNLTPGNYSYTVAAVDAAANTSPQSAAKTTTVYAAADLNKDGIIGLGDATIVLKNFGSPIPGTPGDLNGDNSVNLLDIRILLNKWGTAG